MILAQRERPGNMRLFSKYSLFTAVFWSLLSVWIQANDRLISDSWESRSIDGNMVRWDSRAKGHVFCFLGCECPVARFYASKLSALHGDLTEKGIRFIAVMSNQHDSEADILRFQKELEIPFPILRDAGQTLAARWKATRTAEVVVLDPRGEVVYRGRVDDQVSPGIKRPEAKQHDLRDSLLELIEKGETHVASTSPVGCLITFERKVEGHSKLTFNGEIGRIFNKHCYDCHRRGDIGPFDISVYEEVRGWADMICEVIDNGRMPPWHANKEHGKFMNARSMSLEEIEKVKRWVSEGSPLGSASEGVPWKEVDSGWRLPKEPDLIVSMRDRPYRIPAEGTVDYQYFVVDPKLTEDKWVDAAQVIPGNLSVVHHAIVFIRPPDGTPFSGTSWLTAYVPGQRVSGFPSGHARFVPAGSKFVFQMHYTPNGTEQLDVTQLGISFVDTSSVTHEVTTIMGIDQSFEIPPHANHYMVHGNVRVPQKDAVLLAVSPHMHLRGKAFQLRSYTSRGESKILLDVPRYDFNWQHTYEFEEPVPFSSIDRLEFDVVFDNSEGNPSNPDPEQFVMWGDQTWEEMAVAFFEIATPRNSEMKRDRTVRSRQNPSVDIQSAAAVTDDAASKWADNYIRRFDRDRNGILEKSEVSDLVRVYSFHLIDQNGDERLTRDELVRSFEARRGR